MSQEVDFVPNKEFTIDLDMKPSQRWISLLNAFKSELQETLPNFNALISQMFGFSVYPAQLLVSGIKASQNMLYIEEIESIATFLNIPFDHVLFLQLCYELNSCCTSLVTRVNGTKTFFRTMDWPLNFLNKLTVDLTFIKSGNVVCYATSWVGYIGIVTATVPQKYSIAMNFRLTKDRTILSILSNIYALINLKWPIGYLIREVCTNNYNYNMMVSTLTSSPVVSPCYFTVSPASDELLPFIITRDTDGYSIKEGEFVIQTNCDHDKCEPNILHSVERRSKAKIIINSNNNNFSSVEMLLSAMLTYPIINEETIYYTIMNPKLGLHKSATYQNEINLT